MSASKKHTHKRRIRWYLHPLLPVITLFVGFTIGVGLGTQKVSTEFLGALSFHPRRIADELRHRAAPRIPRRAIVQDVTPPSGLIGQVPVGPSVTFPRFERTVHPVNRVPDWGAMRSPSEWNRPYRELRDANFVPVPEYDLDILTIPLASLLGRLRNASIDIITAKLYYSTRHFGAYNIDAGEFSGIHPGIDLKLAEGTPIGSIAGGRVVRIRHDEFLGLFVMVEHRHPTGGRYVSIYGHLGTVSVGEGQDVSPGQTIGTIGMTGNTSGPHLHLQIDRVTGDAALHTPYFPAHLPSRSEADRWTIHPIRFIDQYKDGI